MKRYHVHVAVPDLAPVVALRETVQESAGFCCAPASVTLTAAMPNSEGAACCSRSKPALT